jgi:hypothetical protein
MEWERSWFDRGAYPEASTDVDPWTGQPLRVAEDRQSLFSEAAYDTMRPEEDGLAWVLLRVAD